jgi:hypothetical protein
MLPTHAIRIALCTAFLCACSEQGEGERCDTNNAQLDCATGLICRSREQLNIEDEGRGVALCCPPDGVPPTVDACRANTPLPLDVPDVPEETPAPVLDAGDGGP